MKKHLTLVSLLALLGMAALPMSALADDTFYDFALDFENLSSGESYLTSDECSNKSSVTFGVTVGEDGSTSRVEATAAALNQPLIKATYHSDQHGVQNFSAQVVVTGPVKIIFGSCAWGGDVTVTGGTVDVATFNTNTGSCYAGDPTAENKTVSATYKGDAATLTISGGSYVPYFAVKAVDSSDLATDYTVTYSLGDYSGCGTAPEAVTVENGSTTTIPSNFTVYREGYTLTGWTDGTSTYNIGAEVTVTADVTLTPVFTENTVSLSDRGEAVTVKFDFQRQDGAPSVAYEGVTGIWVTQVSIDGVSIDVKADFDATKGKFNNSNWNDWAQLNGGTIFTIPSCKGATVSTEAYSTITTTTIDGQTDYTQGTTISYEVASTEDSIDIVIGDGSYYRYIQVVLPVVETSTLLTFDNEAATVYWALTSSVDDAAEVSPEGAFSITSVAVGSDLTVTGTGTPNWGTSQQVKFQPVAGSGGLDEAVEFKAVPYKGITFTPTLVSGDLCRYGTDGGQVDIIVMSDEGVTDTLATGLIPQRNNKSVDEDAKGTGVVQGFSLEVPGALATTEGFSLYVCIHDLGTSKQIGIGNVKITGTVNGTQESVETYTVTTQVSLEGAGTVTLYPAGGTYDSGTEVTITATRNFGYKFINWTDGDGNIVSTEAKFKYTVIKDVTLTANFEAINTYEVEVSVTEPAKDYMVAWSPEPTVVDGKNMYEEGTSLTLTATGNNILTFTGWSDGQTSGTISMTVSENVSLTANFSAVDFIAAWDFWEKGNNGRVADFADSDNDADQLVLRDESGNTVGWLDKSYVNGGYEGSVGGAAVSWQEGSADGDVGNYYWQTKINASNYTNIKVESSMLYNYNAYPTQKVEYSTDGSNWTTIGSIIIPGVKNWTDSIFTLPESLNNTSEIYIRWISDKTSTVDGTASTKDGISLSAIYITGDEAIVDDGTAPKLVSSIPAEGSTTASANGKVVLTFDEKVEASDDAQATLNGVSITPAISGKTAIFAYSGLDYSTEYTFTLPGNSIADLTDNYITEAITITFTTRAKETVTKALYDFIVPDDGTFKEAVAAAAKRDDTSKRYRIFVKQGTYTMPNDSTKSVTGSDGVAYPDPKTYLTTPNVSIIGENIDSTIITNTPPYTASGTACPIEGLRNADVIQMSSAATNTYYQDITLKNGTEDATGRNCALTDQSDKTICYNVGLYGYQDTYLSNNSSGRFYFEKGKLRGRTDFLCGKGDVYYNEVELIMCESGGKIAVPSQPKEYGYIFRNCTVEAETGKSGIDGNFALGRPWGSGTPIALFINTTMAAQPQANGWDEMSGGYPKQFAEYNSVTSSGTIIDLSQRKTIFGDNHVNNPILSADSAALYTVTAVMGADDDWDPTSYTEQASAPENVTLSESALSWNNNNYVLCWAICKNGKVQSFTTDTVYTVDDTSATWSVRAANEMGGLGEATEAVMQTIGISETTAGENTSGVTYYTLSGMRINKPVSGVVIKVSANSDGSRGVSKELRR